MIRRTVEAVQASAARLVFVVTGHEPERIARALAAFDPHEDRAICVPTHAGKRGNPILWDAAYFPQFAALKGDVGAKHLIGENEDSVCEVELGPGVLMDIDTPADL